jgi:nicotinate-nucleotide adenylyltransferase
VRLGIFGGTFDPPHVGHLLAATDAIEHLGLDRLVFVPAAVQPLMAGRTTASAEDRLAMSRVTVGDDPRLETDSIEVERDGLSYTIDTLREFARRSPSAERYFLVGADVLSSFAQWRDPQGVLELATLAVLTRRADSGVQMRDDAIRSDQVHASAANDLDDAIARRSTIVPTRRIDISSTEIRDRVRSGRSIHGFVTDTVAEYISSHGLYR